MKKKDKPLRPDPSRIGADVRGRLSTKKTIMVSPKGRLTKPVVRNPSAPTAAGPRGGGVRVITKTESAIRKDKARVAKTGQLPITRTITDSSKSGKKSYPKRGEFQKLYDGSQTLTKKGYIPLTAAEKKAANEKMKSKGVTPKKKAEPKPKPKPKSRFFTGRGGGMRGGSGGGLYGNMFRR